MICLEIRTPNETAIAFCIFLERLCISSYRGAKQFSAMTTEQRSCVDEKRRVEKEKQKKSVLLVRHCEDEKFRDATRSCAARWTRWHSEKHRRKNQDENICFDPCLTRRGCKEATSGVVDEDTGEHIRRGSYGGVSGGLSPISRRFDAQVVFCSPLSRALQTAFLVFGSKESNRKDAPTIVVHPALKEIKPDFTYNGRYPRGKPSCVPLTLDELKASALRCAPECYKLCDWSAVEAACDSKGCFFDAHQSKTSMQKDLWSLVKSIEERTDTTRVAIVSHGGVIQELLRSSEKMIHGGFAEAELAGGKFLLK